MSARTIPPTIDHARIGIDLGGTKIEAAALIDDRVLVRRRVATPTGYRSFCLALSEASDGAAAGARTVFAAILGTGVGGGLVFGRELVPGVTAIAGEWGHNPLP